MKLTPMTQTTSTPARGLRATLVIAALATAACVAGCGGKSTETASTDEGQTRVASVTQPTSQPAVPALASASNMPSGRSGIVALGDSLPPEVSATVVDSVIHPGDVIEITAETSDDASQVTLSDGIARMQLFKREPGSNTWHVLYRVPIRARTEKLGLGVMALNDVNRWRRVWVFVEVQPAETRAATDSLPATK